MTFNEILVLAAAPLVLVLPSTAIDFIPLWFSLTSVAVGSVGVLIVVYKTPTGQSPVEWFPAFVDRKIKPDKFQLKPKDNTKYGAPNVTYLDVIHTANMIEAENPKDDDFNFDAFEASIDNAEKLERPEWAKKSNGESESGVIASLVKTVKP